MTTRISADERRSLATKTEAPITEAVEKRLIATARLLHAGMGLATEAGEFLDQLKKHIFYGKPLDKLNLKEELGDLDWYSNLACDALDTNMEKIERANIIKLATRYTERFTEYAAKIRNLVEEQRVLEESLGETDVGPK